LTMDERLPDILEECLGRISAGASVEECLASFPEQRGDIEQPLRVAAHLSGLPRLAMPEPTRAGLEARMLALAAARRAAPAPPSPAAPTAPVRPTWRSFDPVAALAGILRALGYQGPLAQPWLRLAAIVIGVALALVLGAGALAAARAIVNIVRPAATPTAAPTAPAPRGAPFALDGPVVQVAQESWVVGTHTVAIDPRTAISGPAAIGDRVHVRGIILENGTLLAQLIVVTRPVATPCPADSPCPAGTPAAPPTALPVAPPAQVAPPTIQPTAPSPASTVVPAPPPADNAGNPSGDTDHDCNGQQRGRDDKKCDPKPHDKQPEPKKPKDEHKKKD
jgi:hypothetical protein